ncbi:MAG TPA: hypothetical protein VNZ45_08170, partial [Bacteroidia bacterium]|nr:hypothetical protein [Bacteroidia bacterium]
YLEDFRNSITSFVHTDLTWFFDEWIDTPKDLDYGIQSIKKGKGKDEYIIRFVRKGAMQMPIDFNVISKKDSLYKFYIPNTWFEKQTSAKILPRWIGWGKVEPTYDATVTIPGGIDRVAIDTTLRLADINMLNNFKPFPIKYYFDSKIYHTPDWTNYEAFFGPSLWYNAYDGLKLGMHVHGDYMLFKDNVNATLWFNTGLFQNIPHSTPNINNHQIISFTLAYQTPTDNFIPNSSISLYGQSMDGLNEGKVIFQMKDNSLKNTFYTQLQSLYRPHIWDTNYLIYPQLWQTKAFNNTVSVGLKHDYKYSAVGRGTIDLRFKSSLLTPDYNYSQTSLTILEYQKISKTLFLHARLFAQYGTGTNVPYESALYAAGINPEGLMDNAFTRAQGIVPQDWTGYGSSIGHFQEGGGLNLRGYAGYVLPEVDSKGNLEFAYNGNSGAAINAELDLNDPANTAGKGYFVNHPVNYLNIPALLSRFVQVVSKSCINLTTYLFGDAGVININPNYSRNLELSSIRADAGVGVALTIQRWGPLQTVKPLTIRLDMPLFLNEPPASDEGYVQWRWVIGISRCF